MLCVNCGQPLQPGAAFCTSCGSAQPAADPFAPAPFTPTPPAPPAPEYRTAPPAPEPYRGDPYVQAGTGGFSPASLLFMEAVLRALGTGSVFKRVFGIALGVIAVSIALGGLFLWYNVWNLMDVVSGAGAFGLMVFQLLFIVVLYMVVHTYVIRAREAFNMEETAYPMTFLVALAVRLMGEAAAIWIGGLSLGLGIVQALVGDSVGDLGRMLDLPVPFGSAGLVGAIGGLVVAFAILTVAYWLAEALTTLADVARNTREMSAALREQASA